MLRTVVVLGLVLFSNISESKKEFSLLQRFVYGDFILTLDVKSYSDLYSSEDCIRQDNGKFAIKCTEISLGDNNLLIGQLNTEEELSDIDTTGLFNLHKGEVTREVAFHYGDLVKSTNGVYLFATTIVSQHSIVSEVFFINDSQEGIDIEKIDEFKGGYAVIYKTSNSVILTGNNIPIKRTGWAREYTGKAHQELKRIGEFFYSDLPVEHEKIKLDAR